MLAPSASAVARAETRLKPIVNAFHAEADQGRRAVADLQAEYAPKILAILHNTGIAAVTTFKAGLHHALDSLDLDQSHLHQAAPSQPTTATPTVPATTAPPTAPTTGRTTPGVVPPAPSTLAPVPANESGPIPTTHANALSRLHDLLSTSHLIPHALQPNEPATQAVNGVNPWRDTREIFAPRTVAEVQMLVREARAAGHRVRVVGSAHTRPKEAILDSEGPGTVLMTLKNYRGVTLDAQNGIALVKAGTNLGRDPDEPLSTVENGLCDIIDKAGWMLPEVGGILHQTVGGFLATASAGGSLKYSFHDAIIGYTIVDGRGDVLTFGIDDPSPLSSDDVDDGGEGGGSGAEPKPHDPHNSWFYAAACCAGLCGIITDIKLLLTPRADVQGVQQTFSAQVREGCPVNLFGDADPTGVPELSEYFERVEYCRMLYWPQPYLPPRLQIWQANRVEANTMQVQPYVELEPALQVVAAVVLELIWNWTFNGRMELDWLVRNLLGLFVPLDDVRPFLDSWQRILPMDNSIADRVIPTSYTELWVSPSDATRAMRAVRGLHARDPASVGNFFTEIYTAKRSPFWLSPSNAGDRVRLDVNWFQYNSLDGHVGDPFHLRLADPVPFFAKYWDALDSAKIPYTTHMGKYRPRSHATRERLRSDYPKYDAWLKVRAEMDPDQIFMTKYWARELQIDSVAPRRRRPSVPTPRSLAAVLRPQEPEQEVVDIHDDDAAADAKVKAAVQRAMEIQSGSRSPQPMGHELREQPSFVVVDADDGRRIPQARNGKPLAAPASPGATKRKSLLPFRRGTPEPQSADAPGNNGRNTPASQAPLPKRSGTLTKSIGRYFRELGDAIRGRARVAPEMVRVERDARREQLRSASNPELMNSYDTRHRDDRVRLSRSNSASAGRMFMDEERAAYLAHGPVGHRSRPTTGGSAPRKGYGLEHQRSRSLDFGSDHERPYRRGQQQYADPYGYGSPYGYADNSYPSRSALNYTEVTPHYIDRRAAYQSGRAPTPEFASPSHPRTVYVPQFDERDRYLYEPPYSRHERDYSMPVGVRVKQHQLAQLQRGQARSVRSPIPAEYVGGQYEYPEDDRDMLSQEPAPRRQAHKHRHAKASTHPDALAERGRPKKASPKSKASTHPDALTGPVRTSTLDEYVRVDPFGAATAGMSTGIGLSDVEAPDQYPEGSREAPPFPSPEPAAPIRKRRSRSAHMAHATSSQLPAAEDRQRSSSQQLRTQHGVHRRSHTYVDDVELYPMQSYQQQRSQPWDDESEGEVIRPPVIDRSIRPPRGEGLNGPRATDTGGWYDDTQRSVPPSAFAARQMFDSNADGVYDADRSAHNTPSRARGRARTAGHGARRDVDLRGWSGVPAHVRQRQRG